MSKPARPAIVRFYVDADVLGLAKGGRHRPPCPITRTDTPDARWIPETAKRQWLIVTRDRHIQEHRAEIEAVRATGARMVVLGGDEALDTFHQLEVFMCQWRRIEAVLDEAGPFIYIATRTTMRQVPI